MDLTGQAASSTIGARAMAAGTPFWAKHGEKHGKIMENYGNIIWLWINTYENTNENTIFSGLFTSINPSYFDVNRRGTRF